MKKQLLLWLLSTAIISGCNSTNQQDIAVMSTNQQYKQVLPQAEIMPSTEQVNGKQIRAVILPTETVIKLAQQAQLETTVYSTLEDILQKAGLDLIDRSMGSKVKNELMAYEASGQYLNHGVDVADIAVLPTITKTTFKKTFTKADTWQDKTGKSHTTPASCRYIAHIGITYKTYSLPELSLLSNTPVKGNTMSTIQTNDSSCYMSDTDVNVLVAEATENAVSNGRTLIQNTLSPKAYVIEYRAMANNHIILVSMGQNRQLTPGQTIQFFRQTKKVNDLTQQTRISQSVIGKGRVTKSIQQTVAWVDIDAKTAKKLKLGDVVGIVYEKSWSDIARSGKQLLTDLF